ncbi:hypothetical protein PL78_15265 [Yersinia entomophaga]|uniref:Uncharacterized protein n=1 Tax=Yersinia entomophaga TaxID=935293 RepID=A0ABM6BN95_YERET|nr:MULTISPECIES: hypothetical protein [Yersinia]ANI31174.1 hypothetical protein PL78_15265 [Yersinia entomophaga]
MRQKLQHTEQVCFAQANTKLFRLQCLQQEANFYRSKGYSTTCGNIMLRLYIPLLIEILALLGHSPPKLLMSISLSGFIGLLPANSASQSGYRSD